SLNLSDLRGSPTLGRLLSRAEIFVLAGLPHASKLAVDELETGMTHQLGFVGHTAAFLYLSPLQYRSGAYLKAINITAKLGKAQPDFWRNYPEQLLIYFPMPYAEDFARNAQENSLAPEALLGIARQESGFSPDIRSSANAVGVMQLIHATGRRFARELGLPTDH